MENITKKLLLMKVSLVTAIAIKLESLRWRARKNELESTSVPVTSENTCILEKTDVEYDIEIEGPKESIVDRIDREMMKYAQEGARGIHILFTNIKFLGAILAKRSDIISLMLEQYFVLGKINGATIQSFLESHYFSFTEEELVKLNNLINTDSRKVVLT